VVDVHLEKRDGVAENVRALRTADLGLVFWAVLANLVALIITFNCLVLLTPLRILLLSAAVTLALVWACGFAFIKRDERLTCWLAVAALAALFFSGELAPYYLGGQDPGYYTAMAELFARGNPLSFADAFRSELTPELREQYDNFVIPSVDRTTNGTTTLLFYPLHPALMALAIQIFGTGHHTTLMGLCFVIVVVAAYLVTFELIGNRQLATLAAVLFAFNPALVFLSKFPVSEMTATALLLPAGYHLVAGYRTKQANTRVLHGIAAVLCFNGYCLTRMSFPMLAPFFALIIFLAIVRPGVTRGERSYLILVSAAIAATCASSLLFYFIKEPALFYEITDKVYAPILAELCWFLGFGIAFLALGSLCTLNGYARVRLLLLLNRTIDLCQRFALKSPGMLLLILSLPSLMFLIRTGTLSGTKLDTQPPGWEMIRFHPIFVLALFLSPFLCIPLFLPRSTDDDGIVTLLITYVVVTWSVFLTYTTSMPWLYFFGRKLFPEILPFALIASLIMLFKSPISLRWKSGLSGLALAWSVLFTVVQLGVSEGEVGRPFQEIAAHLQKRDVLIIPTHEFDVGQSSLSQSTMAILTVIPLRYALGINTFISEARNAEELFDQTAKIRGKMRSNVYVLSTINLTTHPDFRNYGLVAIDEIPLKIRQLVPAWSRFLLPTEPLTWSNHVLYLMAIQS
jgi:hypothetical protein